MQVTGAQAKCVFAYFTYKQLAEGPSNPIILANFIPEETCTPVLETHTQEPLYLLPFGVWNPASPQTFPSSALIIP